MHVTECYDYACTKQAQMSCLDACTSSTTTFLCYGGCLGSSTTVRLARYYVLLHGTSRSKSVVFFVDFTDDVRGYTSPEHFL